MLRAGLFGLHASSGYKGKPAEKRGRKTTGLRRLLQGIR